MSSATPTLQAIAQTIKKLWKKQQAQRVEINYKIGQQLLIARRQARACAYGSGYMERIATESGIAIAFLYSALSVARHFPDEKEFFAKVTAENLNWKQIVSLVRISHFKKKPKVVAAVGSGNTLVRAVKAALLQQEDTSASVNFARHNAGRKVSVPSNPNEAWLKLGDALRKATRNAQALLPVIESTKRTVTPLMRKQMQQEVVVLTSLLDQAQTALK